MEHMPTNQLIANSQLLKPFIEPILLIWMIVIRCSWNFERPPSSGIFRCCNYFSMVKKITHRRKHSFFDSKRSWIDRYNWKKYLIDNSEAYSEPSLTFTMEIFPNIFNSKKLFSGVPETLVLIKSNTKITTTGKMSLLGNSLNLIFEK